MSGWSHAFSLSKQQVAEAEPPGTVRLVEHEGHEHDEIRLIPTPSRSPLDPLNFPQWRKYAVLLTMSLWAFIASFGSAAVAPALPIMQFQLLEIQRPPPLSLSTLSHLVAVNVLLLGTSNIFWVPLANTFGRRPVLIIAMLLSVFFSMWCGLAKSFNSLLAARCLQGLAFGPADTVAPAIVGDVFFVHERGRAMAIYTVFLSVGSFVAGIAGSYIAGNLGWRYIFWITLALCAFNLLLQIFFVPETSFDRAAQLAAEGHGGNNSSDGSVNGEKEPTSRAHEHQPAAYLHGGRPHVNGTISFAQSMKVGIYRGNLVKHFLDPWRSLLFPGTWVVMGHYGGLLAGLITISTIGPVMLSMPPYLWGNNVGLLNIGALVGGFLGFFSTYFLVDRLTVRGAKHTSHGLAEPERRLPVMFPALFLATTGIWTFGFSAAHPAPHAWAGMVVGYGMVAFGIMQIPSIGFSYLIDSYHSIASDCFVMTTISRAVVSFAWTFFAATWVGEAGASLPFGIFGMLMGIFALLTIPLWIYGKRLRIATAGHLPARQ